MLFGPELGNHSNLPCSQAHGLCRYGETVPDALHTSVKLEHDGK
jgi:hypothetical protein